MDKIHIRGLRVYAFHGVGDEEKQKGQPFMLDITMEADLSIACGSDRLTDTINYSAAVKAAERAMGTPCSLIEHAAEHVAQAVLSEFEKVQAVTVVLKKPRAPIAADFEYVAVELRRTRGEPHE
ncbi:MAG: dihydroneopterin aldolase [Clostridia bacterium]|nr:dihydroneopterin aldolase [Clostridia bacterium]